MDIGQEVISVIQHLLPGFLAAWIFYGLTAHPKKDQFERVVEALIFTAIIQLFMPAVRIVWWKWHVPGVYWEDRVQWASLAVGAIIGLAFSGLANWNICHKILGFCKITKRTSYPSEWYSAFHRVRRFVILHLDGERRLKGWPEEWPDSPDKGHFIIMYPQWVMDDGTDVPIVQTERMIIPAKDVDWVEMLFRNNEINKNKVEIAEMQKPLLELLNKEKHDGIKSTPTTAAPKSTSTEESV